nr:DUF2185 domain-containing protein [Paenibacillus sp. XY044]
MAGDEDEDYMDNDDNHTIYLVTRFAITILTLSLFLIRRLGRHSYGMNMVYWYWDVEWEEPNE